MGQGQFNAPIGQLEAVLKSYSLGKLNISDAVQQTLALMAGSDGMQRKILRASETSVLNVTSPRSQDVLHVVGVGANDTWSGDYKLTTEALVLAHPDNAGRIWARTDVAATTGNAIPIDAGNGCIFPVDNLKNLFLMIETDADIAVILYTR